MASPLLPLVLSVKCKNWRMFDQNSADADAEFQRVRKKALDRDGYACRFCGFRSLKYQEVHHVNDDHADNRIENLVTACPYCHSVQHIGLAGQNDEAVLVWLPEISQATLHHLVRTAQVAQRQADVIRADPKASPAMVKTFREASETSKAVLATFRAREAEAEARIGTSDARELANAMLMLPDEAYAKRGEFLAGVRLLPLGRRFQDREDVMARQVDTWTETGGPYASLKPNSWTGLMRSVLGS